jgi:hypothetical protein
MQDKLQLSLRHYNYPLHAILHREIFKYKDLYEEMTNWLDGEHKSVESFAFSKEKIKLCMEIFHDRIWKVLLDQWDVKLLSTLGKNWISSILDSDEFREMIDDSESKEILKSKIDLIKSIEFWKKYPPKQLLSGDPEDIVGLFLEHVINNIKNINESLVPPLSEWQNELADIAIRKGITRCKNVDTVVDNIIAEKRSEEKSSGLKNAVINLTRNGDIQWKRVFILIGDEMYDGYTFSINGISVLMHMVMEVYPTGSEREYLKQDHFLSWVMDFKEANSGNVTTISVDRVLHNTVLESFNNSPARISNIIRKLDPDYVDV